MRVMGIAMVFGSCLSQLFGCASAVEIKNSDHFNGAKFHNPTMTEEYSHAFSDVFRMMREGRPKWPKHVENHGISRLHQNLGPDDIGLTFVGHATSLIQLIIEYGKVDRLSLSTPHCNRM